MRRFLIFRYAPHNFEVIDDANERYTLGDFMKTLCAPHEEAYTVREVDMENAWETDSMDPSIPDEFLKYAQELALNISFSEYQFNTVFYFAKEIDLSI